MEFLTPAGFSVFLLEAIKRLIRLVLKKPDFEFATAFYVVLIPLLNLFTPFALAWMGLSVVVPSWVSVAEIAKAVVLTLVQSLITVFFYEQGLKPLVDYSRTTKNVVAVPEG